MSKILIIDDAELCELLEEFLVGEAFQVNTANNGLDGIESIKQNQPDLIILNVMMPILNGFDTLRTLRANGSV